MVQASETTADAMSGSSAPRKFELKNWVPVKLTAATKIAGKVSFTPLTPSIKKTMKKGTVRLKGTSIRPTIAET